jgi:7-cyano-7-deazaguanine synthase
MKTIVLLSGGLDSATVLAAYVSEGVECLAIGFDYDQPHRVELDHAEDIAKHYGVPFELVGLPAMLNIKVDDVVFAGRNLILASLAIAVAQARGFDMIAVGCNADDSLRFPDCRPAFWRSLKQCAEAYGVHVATPLIYMTKRNVVETARKLSVPIELTWSCYEPRRVTFPIERIAPCGVCLACKTRQEAL